MNNVLYIFTGEVQDVTPNIFTNENYNSLLQQLRDQFSPVLVNTTYYNVHLFNQVNVIFTRCGKIYPNIENKNDFCYQCYIDGPDLLFVNLRIRDKIYEPFTPVKTSTINEKSYMRTMLIKNTGKNIYEEKKYMIIPGITCKIERKLF